VGGRNQKWGVSFKEKKKEKSKFAALRGGGFKKAAS